MALEVGFNLGQKRGKRDLVSIAASRAVIFQTWKPVLGNIQSLLSATFLVNLIENELQLHEMDRSWRFYPSLDVQVGISRVSNGEGGDFHADEFVETR